MHVTAPPMGYNMIIGRDILELLGIDLQFSTNTIKWDHAVIPMRPNQCTTRDSYQQTLKSPSLDKEFKRITEILDAKYEPADLPKIVEQSNHLNLKEKQQLLELLQKHENLFDGTLGKWKGPLYHNDLQS